MDAGLKTQLCDGFSDRLRQVREARKVSVNRLAVQAQVARDLVRVLERGGQVPRARTVLQLASALRVSPAWLAYGAGGIRAAEADVTRFGNRLERSRLLRRIDKQDLASRIGGTRAGIRLLERGAHLTTIDRIEHLAAALRVKVAWLAFGIRGT